MTIFGPALTLPQDRQGPRHQGHEAHRHQGVALQTLLGFEEISYFVMFGYLAVAGPGPVSIDHFILRTFRKDRPASDYGA